MTYHIHVYKAVGMVHLDINANTPEEARLEALKRSKEHILEESDCEYIAITFE